MRGGVGLSVGATFVAPLLLVSPAVILGSESHEAHDHTLPSDGSGSLQAHFF
jgi:hypothetical protein